GTWRAGVNNAEPGFIMLADPQKGDSYFEENAPPAGVDGEKVTTLMASASVRFGTFNKDCVQTLNTSGLDPSDIETKFYVPGIGSVLEVDVDGTRQQLVSFNGQTRSVAAPHAGLAQGHATDHSQNGSLHHVLAGPSHQGA